MIQANTKVKMGIFTKGSSVKVVAECDLITQDNGHKDEAIYLVEISVMRDPRTPLSDKEISTWEKTMVQNFKDNKFGFKAKDRAQADSFIAYNTKGNWEVIREFAEI